MDNYVKILIIYFIAINFIGFCAMGIDKFKAQRNYWRIPESTLIMITVLGGGIGDLIGMYLFRHKTKKIKFTWGIPLIMIMEVLIIYTFLSDFLKLIK